MALYTSTVEMFPPAEWLELEGTSRDHLDHPSCTSMDT